MCVCARVHCARACVCVKLDLDLSLTDVVASSKIYDRREDFNLEIVNFPFIGGNIRHSPSCGVYISKFIFLREYVLI